MSSTSGTPPKGDSASLDVAPTSKPIGSSAVDDGWFDVDVEMPVESPTKVSVESTTAAVEPTLGSTIDGPGKAATDNVAAVSSSTASDKTPKEASPTESAPPQSFESVDNAHVPRHISSLLPRSLSPVVLASEGKALSEPPMAPVAGALLAKTSRKEVTKQLDRGVAKSEDQAAKKSEQKSAETGTVADVETSSEKSAGPSLEAEKEPESTKVAGPKSKTRYTLLAAAAVVAVAAAAVPFLLPKRVGKTGLPVAAESARAAEKPRVAASAAFDDDETPPLVTVAASNAPPPTDTNVAAAAASAAAASASASASNAPLDPSAAPSVDSFSDAFQKHAAKKDAKWAGMKARSDVKVSSGAQPVTTAAPSTPTKANHPGAADPMDVLKRLEESRKSKR